MGVAVWLVDVVRLADSAEGQPANTPSNKMASVGRNSESENGFGRSDGIGFITFGAYRR